MLDAYIIKQIHHEKNLNRNHRSEARTEKYHPRHSHREQRENQNQRGIEVVDFTI